MTGRKLIQFPDEWGRGNGRWGFDGEGDKPSDEFTSGESIEIHGKGDTWYPGRFENTDGKYYIILEAGFCFFPMAGTIARRPKR